VGSREDAEREGKGKRPPQHDPELLPDDDVVPVTSQRKVDGGGEGDEKDDRPLDADGAPWRAVMRSISSRSPVRGVPLARVRRGPCDAVGSGAPLEQARGPRPGRRRIAHVASLVAKLDGDRDRSLKPRLY